MTTYLLDTNHASAMLKKNALLLQRFSEQTDGGNVGISVPSIAEMWFMVFNSARVPQNSDDLKEVLDGLEHFDFSENAAMEFGRVKTELQSCGKRAVPFPIRIRRLRPSHGSTIWLF